MKAFAAILVFAVASLICLAAYASEPLVELVASPESTVSDAGRVAAWRNVGALGGEARAVCGELRLSSDGRSFAFYDARLELRLPDSARELRNWTVIAVARVDRPLSIGLLSSRDGAVPLAQFDYDETGALRFIARDRAGRTLRAALSVRQGEPFVASVVGRTDASGITRVQLTVGERSAEASERIELPVWGERLQIGGLEFPNARFSWQGEISELWFFDSALDGAELERRSAEAAARHGIDQTRATARPDDSWNVLDRPKFVGEPDREIDADVCVVGAGSAGCAAAIAAGRAGARVALVERQKRLGGTGTNAFVSNWEGGPGDAVARELYERMKKLGGAGVAKEYPHDEIKAPMGLKIVDEKEPYENSLTRAFPPEGGYRSVAYLPAAFDRAARDMLAATGRVEILDETTFFQAEPNADRTRVESVLCETKSGDILRVKARVFIDASGDVWLCRALGIKTRLGADSRAEFGELGAPEFGNLTLNAIARCYLIEPRENPKRQEPVAAPFPQCAYVSGWLDGPRAVNMLTSLPGAALAELGYDECMKRTEAIVHAHWSWLQTQPGFENYELTEIAPMLGIREGYRVDTRYVLRESDLAQGWENQPHKDMIAVADHPCDIHGEGGVLTGVKTAYGAPFRCLIPNSSYVNLLVACRGAGFSKIAASSFRLQRTMIQLGSAAGLAAAWAAKERGEIDKIDVDALVKQIDARANYPIPPQK